MEAFLQTPRHSHITGRLLEVPVVVYVPLTLTAAWLSGAVRSHGVDVQRYPADLDNSTQCVTSVFVEVWQKTRIYSGCRRRSHVTGRLPEVPVVVYTVHVSDSRLTFDDAQTYCRQNETHLVPAITSAHQQKRVERSDKGIGRTERPLRVDWCPVRRREHNSFLPFFLHFAAQESVSALHRPQFCSVVEGSWILLSVDVG